MRLILAVLCLAAAAWPQGPELALSLRDAVTRGIQSNIAVVVREAARDSAQGADKVALSALLPKLDISVAESGHQNNLAAFGFSGFGGAFPGFKSVVGPFALFDARGNLSASLLNMTNWYARKASTENLAAATATITDARDSVAALVAQIYFQAVALESRLRSAEAQRDTSVRLFQQAQDQKTAGVVAGIDVLRAQVQLQGDEQRVIAARNDWEKQKLQLANAIGLNLSQAIRLTDTQMSDAALSLLQPAALTEALDNRADYRALKATVQSTETRLKSVRAEHLPTGGVTADYGVLGQNPATTHGTFSVTASVRMPIFEGGRIAGNVQQIEAQLREQRARQNDLAQKIDLEIRSALLDVESARQRSAAARTAVTLADLQLTQARDRFTAGVTDNLEVVQSQSTVAAAQDSLIASLFELQLARTALARALGRTEQNLERFLLGRTN
jgi:outer membrane protein TolC